METATNPSTGERLVLIEGAWKPFTESATGPKGAKAYLVGNAWVTDTTAAPVKDTRSLVDQIPDMPAPGSQTQPKQPGGIGEKIFGAGEAALATGTGMVAGAVAPLVGLYGDLTSGVSGRAASQRAGAQRGRQFAEDYTYAPRSETGQRIAGAINEFGASALGATPVLNTFAPLTPAMGRGVRQAAGEAVTDLGPAVEAAGNQIMPVPGTKAGIASSRAIQASDKAWGNAPRLDAAKDAVRLGLAIDPVEVSPTTKNKMVSSGVGRSMAQSAGYKKNIERLATNAREELGLTTSDALDTAGFNKAIKNATGSYEEIKALPRMEATPEVFTALDKQRPGPHLMGEKSTFNRINEMIDEARGKIAAGQTGAQILDNIKNLREQANDIFTTKKNGPVDPVELMVAKTKLGLANTLELMIEEALPTSDLVKRFRADRTQAAKVYAYRTATNVGQGRIDPLTLAAMTEVDNALTGNIAATSRVINNFPSTFTPAAPVPVGSNLRRYGTGGIIGGGLGSLVGNVPAGVIVGAGGQEIGRRMMANRMMSPKYQAANVLPVDPRMPQLPTPPTATPNLPVPFSYEGTVGRDPNWVPGRGPVTPEVPPVPGNRLPPPDAGIAMENVARQRAGAAQTERFHAQSNEAWQRAVEEAQRVPAGRGQVLELDPVTGKLRPAEEAGTALPPVKPLQSAVQKLQGTFDPTSVEAIYPRGKSAQPFALDALEKIAWDRTKVELDLVAPGFTKLTDKEILGKMQDRAWVAATVQKAREQAQAFAEIAQRSQERQAQAQAAAHREMLLDAAEMLEEQLRLMPTPKLGQGPKTRAARNTMIEENQRRNSME